ncbi:AbrB/MazE/SpoVT family DNA-binding domain-containing protein [Methylobacterium oxalidis]|uniref:AbrB/MazE/SpoVT family DNA-binding domain-containing protein n=1 Tax=Methylobacterium oxalidis TaxID=944322 RepID=UPI003315C426
MEAKVIRWGDDLAVRLTSDEADRLGISEGQTVEIVPRAPEAEQWHGRRYVNGLPVYSLAEMVAEMRRLGPDFEPPTVDWGPDVGAEIIADDDPR